MVTRLSKIIVLWVVVCVLSPLLIYANPLPKVIDSYNGLFFNNSEVLIDLDGNGDISVGDIFWGVFQVQQIKAPSDIFGQTGPSLWFPGGGIYSPIEISGYFATKVMAVYPPGGPAPPNHPLSAVSSTLSTILLGPVTVDPNNILDTSTGEVLRIFEDTNLDFNDATQGSALATATDGALLWSLGIGPSKDGLSSGGYWYTLAPVVPPGSGDVGESFGGLNIIIAPPTDFFGQVNDPNEVYSSNAGVISGLNVQFWFNSEIFRLPGNPNLIVSPNEPMHFGSNDPAVYFPKEPTCSVDIEKLVRKINTNDPFVDADVCTDASVPVINVPGGAKYKLIVENTGDSVLTNCTITDTQLGINKTLTYNLAPHSGPIEITSSDIGFENLDQPDRCQAAGELKNTATIVCDCADLPTPATVTDSDDACVKCVELFGQCRMTHGSVTVNQDGTFTIEGPYAETTQPPQSQGKKNAKGSSTTSSPTPKYTWGGQIGAPQASGPPYGEMTHTQHDSPTYGSFTFHAGGHSASEPTEISSVECADPKWCENARCAPFKQLFWDGIGEFENMSMNNPFPGCTVRQKSHKQGGTLHYFKAHVADFGEPGGNFPPGDGPQPSEALCSWTSGGTDINNVNLIGGTDGSYPPPDGTLHGDKGSQNCDECPDYYEIEIHCTTDPNSPIIYQVHDFIDRGNIQIHPEVGQSCPY